MELPKIQRITIPGARSPMRVADLTEDKNNVIWLSTNSGLYEGVLMSQKDEYHFKKILIQSSQDILPRVLGTDNENRLFVSTTHGPFLQIQQGVVNKFERVSGIQYPYSIIFDNENNAWVGNPNGLWSYKRVDVNQPSNFNLDQTFNSDPLNAFSLNNNVIKSIYKDDTGVIWVGTNGGGINKFDPSRKPFYHFGTDFNRNGNQYKKIRSILEDSEENIWVGTEGGGLFLQTCKNGDCQGYQHFQSVGNASNVFSLHEVREGDQKLIYAGSQHVPYLQKISLSSNQAIEIEEFANIPGPVFTILQDKNLNIWLGTYNQGLSRWIPQQVGNYDKKLFLQNGDQKSGLKSNIIRKLLEDSQGNIWIGTGNGLSMIKEPQTMNGIPEILTFLYDKEDPTSISHNYILDIYESKAGEIWVGTFGGGLNCLLSINDNGTAQFKRYTEKNGLPNNVIKNILEDNEGNLWLSSNRGLSKFNPIEESFQNFTTSDGLQASEFLEGASFKKRNGELLFGGVNGFNVFDPDEIKINQIPPKLRFTKLLVHNQEVKPAQKINGRVLLSESISTCESITFKYQQNDFSIEFSALHYAAPEKNRYAYKLEGYHEDWVMTNADKRFATFTNLPHGEYTLFVKASNGDNIWTEQPIALGISITPPWWLTWYSYLAYSALIALSLWLFRRYTVISTHEKHRLTLEHIEREKLEELNQMKLRFFTNISHELRTPLTLIIAPLEHILEKRKNLSPEKLQQQYHYMYKNAKYLLRLVNQLLDFRKLDGGRQNLRVGKGNIVNFIRETTEPFQFLASKKKIEFDIVNTDNNIYTYFDPDVIEKVIYNLLSNAFKFTPNGGAITIQLVEKNLQQKNLLKPYIEIRVKDSGPGISKQKVKKVFQRFYKESSKEQNKDGAGIGLAHTKSLVELHHGQIKAETINGEGACFIIQLPQDKKSYLKSEIDQFYLERFQGTSDPLEYLVAEPIAEEIFEYSTNTSFENREEHLPLLLFIDDNRDIRMFVRETFNNDFRIIEAENGEDGFEVALSSLPDIIVSDIMMPKKSGIELCTELKTNSLTSHIPVVLLTAKSAKEDELVGFQTGADAYVVKPFKAEVLRAQLMSIYLQREKLREAFRREIIMEPEDVTVTSADEEFLTNAMSIIEEHMSNSEFNVEALVKEMHISRSKLYLKLKGAYRVIY